MGPIPMVACVPHAWFKHLHFILESKREAAQSHLKQDFEQLFSPHYVNGRRAGNYSTAEEEVCDYQQTPQIPNMQNPAAVVASEQGQISLFGQGV